jgi:hypothetical protein
LIDIDGDGIWDYSFSLDDGLLNYYMFVYKKYKKIYDESPGFELIYIIAMMSLFVYILKRKRK